MQTVSFSGFVQLPCCFSQRALWTSGAGLRAPQSTRADRVQFLVMEAGERLACEALVRGEGWLVAPSCTPSVSAFPLVSHAPCPASPWPNRCVFPRSQQPCQDPRTARAHLTLRVRNPGLQWRQHPEGVHTSQGSIFLLGQI